MNNNPLIVTIDGPAGSGKSTVSKMLAKRINATFLDTGAMYRAVTLAAMEKGVDLEDHKALVEVLRSTEFEFIPQEDTMMVTIDGVDSTEQIRRESVAENSQYVAKSVNIREELVFLQRQFAEKNPRMVTEGRDQGSVAFPDANYKFYLTADIKERAKRRQAQLAEKGAMLELVTVEEHILVRDGLDMKRDHGPLVKPEGAIEIDTTNIDAEGVVQKMLDNIKE